MDKIKHPNKLALQHSGLVLLLVVPAAVVLGIRHRQLAPHFAWWVFPLVALFCVATCFAHAYLGAAIGRRKAYTAFIIILLVALVVGLHILFNYISGDYSNPSSGLFQSTPAPTAVFSGG